MTDKARDLRVFADYLQMVATEMTEFAEQLNHSDGQNTDFTWSTYMLVTQAALWEIMKRDGLIAKG